MKAVVYDKKSLPDRLKLVDVSKPIPGDDELLIKVHSVSLNAADYRSMKMGLIPESKIFGADIAGRVESIGKNISLFKPGDEVVGDLGSYGFGGLAEYVAAPEKAMIHKPAKIEFEDAASLPMAALTALQALQKKGNVQKGQEVLILGSSGGVGTFAVQLAKYFGAQVTGVCSSKNVSQTIALGADCAIDYTKEDFRKGNKRYDIILAVNGNYPLVASKKKLNRNGTYIMVGGSLTQIFKSILFGRILSLGSRKVKFLAAKPDRSDLEFLVNLLEKGIIKPVIDRRYTLDRAPEAMTYLKQGHAAGKVIINVETWQEAQD